MLSHFLSHTHLHLGGARRSHAFLHSRSTYLTYTRTSAHERTNAHTARTSAHDAHERTNERTSAQTSARAHTRSARAHTRSARAHTRSARAHTRSARAHTQTKRTSAHTNEAHERIYERTSARPLTFNTRYKHMHARSLPFTLLCSLSTADCSIAGGELSDIALVYSQLVLSV
jgi:hypothetical protein